jgi:hypothetical protein
MDKYKEAIEQGKIDAQLLCSAMGTQQMDEGFLSSPIAQGKH